jgi:HSP20 family protein
MMMEPFSFPAVASGNNEAAERPRALSAWRPAVDISESKDNYVVHMEVPGIRKDDVRIDIDENVLTVKGERKWEKKEEDKEKKYSRVERQYGTFVRRFPLPKDADPQKIKAAYKDGMLDITIPRSTERAKGIEIKVD